MAELREDDEVFFYREDGTIQYGRIGSVFDDQATVIYRKGESREFFKIIPIEYIYRSSQNHNEQPQNPQQQQQQHQQIYSFKQIFWYNSKIS